MQTETSSWQDKFIFELFKVDIGEKKQVTLHREQSFLLKKLIAGSNVAVSAPTSFGKSFVIDAFISIKKPRNVVIIVPTIALTDETRRRLYKKFAQKYKIITTPDIELGENNIFIFPQERAINYLHKINCIDILIIDEFYKAGIAFDKERAPILLKTILELGRKSKQKYYLAPNIKSIKESLFTKNMEFVPLDFNTVFSEIYEVYKSTTDNVQRFKEERLVEILKTHPTKSLIYAGTFRNINSITNVLLKEIINKKSDLLNSFSDWLSLNYNNSYILCSLVQKGIGIHNGRLHRSLSQIQIKLFEDKDGLDTIISTSSIIEGVNTSAENVIIWANKKGPSNLNSFDYKNIIGRGGRMFKYFIGKVFLLEEPPEDKDTQLNLEFTDNLLNSLDKDKFSQELTREQVIKIIAFNKEMDEILGQGVYTKLIKNNAFQIIDSNNLKELIYDMINNQSQWNGLVYLNSTNVDDWDQNLFLILKFMKGVGTSYTNMVSFVKAISNNWNKSIPEIIYSLKNTEITIEKFFELERCVTFKMASMLKDISLIHSHIYENSPDISSFITKLAYAFLPKLVYELEEYGLPRVISKKIHYSKVLNLENSNQTIHEVIDLFNNIGLKNIILKTEGLHPFELYILEYFYDGISTVEN